MARIRYFDPSEADESVRRRFDALPPLNIVRMAAHAEASFTKLFSFNASLQGETALDPRIRELTILLVASGTRAKYEWVQHEEVAADAGVTSDEIAALARGDIDAECFDPEARCVLSFGAQVLAGDRVGDETFDSIKAFGFNSRQIVELLLLIGTYQMLGQLMTTLDLDLDPSLGSAGLAAAVRQINS